MTKKNSAETQSKGQPNIFKPRQLFQYHTTNISTDKPTADTDKPRASIQRPSLGMDHTERIAQAAHIIRRIPTQQERERIMQQMEEEGDFNAAAAEAVRRLVG